MDSSTRHSLIRFGAFAADLGTRDLRKHGIRLKLQPQPFEVLAALLERPGQIVTRDELRTRLWPDGVFVDYDRGLNKAVNRLRDLLGDSADQPGFIETLPQRGYRFIAPVERDEPAAAKAEPEFETGIEPSQTIPIGRKWRIASIGLIAVASALAAVGLYEWHVATPPLVQSITVLPLENLSGNQSQEFLSDGMTDELIGELAHISSLHVISRTSVMRYKGGARKTVPEIAGNSKWMPLSKVLLRR